MNRQRQYFVHGEDLRPGDAFDAVEGRFTVRRIVRRQGTDLFDLFGQVRPYDRRARQAQYAVSASQIVPIWRAVLDTDKSAS